MQHKELALMVNLNTMKVPDISMDSAISEGTQRMLERHMDAYPDGASASSEKNYDSNTISNF